MINPISRIDEHRSFTEQNIRAKSVEINSKTENQVSNDIPPEKFVKKSDEVLIQYDVNRYVQILKNMVIPPQDRTDLSVLLELELNNKISAAELRQLIEEVERKEFQEETTKVEKNTSDDDSTVKDKDILQGEESSPETIKGKEATN
jgi:hypothetical protein